MTLETFFILSFDIVVVLSAEFYDALLELFYFDYVFIKFYNLYIYLVNIILIIKWIFVKYFNKLLFEAFYK